ncbi:hypothetical protein EGW08_023533 [Elysia chlorotica]|uniref:DUF7041 domain-containing protein n=1 Tax=Elysia chlorotica TaxID=188477 RepID=A0A433SIE5_ELYCH|nr:hypothetical protein EGW08_023533 [Elysia chlorotica]
MDMHYEFVWMPFGMMNSGATLARAVKSLLDGMDNVIAYVDDLLVHTETFEQHMATLDELLVGESAQALIDALTSHLQSVAPSSINAVSIKLPEFWTTSPEVWFARVEVQFGTKNITADQTKYDYVVSALDITTAEEVQDVLVHPPDYDKYSALKKALLKAFGKSQTQRDSELLNLNGLGDRKPSALLRKINALNDDPQTLKRALFLSNLPHDVGSILAGQEFDDMDTLAEAADRVWEARCAGVQHITQHTAQPSGEAVTSTRFKQQPLGRSANTVTPAPM